MLQDAWIQGVSTRKVADLGQALGMTGIAKSPVWSLCQESDDRVQAVLERPLAEEGPSLWREATSLKVRQGGRLVSSAAISASAVKADGRREVSGLGRGPSEAATFWSAFLRGLVRRARKGGKLVISEAQDGRKAALAPVLNKTWQRCRVHVRRSLLAPVPKTQPTVVSAAIRQVFVPPDRTAAGEAWRHGADPLRPRFATVAAVMDEAECDVLADLAVPAAHRTKLHATNSLARLNKEVKRRTHVVGIVPNEASVRRLVGAVLVEQKDEWQLQHRSLTLEAMAEVTGGHRPAVPTLASPNLA